MIEKQLLAKFSSWVDEAETVLLIAHEHADGDTIASALAMHHHLKERGKQTVCVSRDLLPDPFLFLPESRIFRTNFSIREFDLVIVFDCGDIRRTGFEQDVRWFARTRRRLVNIDHHSKNDLHRLANVNIVNYHAAATTQVMYHIFQALRWPIPHEIATCLLCGLHTDTGGFKHPNTTPEVLHIAADLMGLGGRLREINRHMINARSVSMLRLWGLALDRIQCHDDLGIVSSMITLDDLRYCRATHEELAGVVNLIKNIPDTKVAILFAEQPDGSIKASLRTDADGVDVAKLAALFGGGGLKKAGGFSIPGRFHQHDGQWQIVWN